MSLSLGEDLSLARVFYINRKGVRTEWHFRSQDLDWKIKGVRTGEIKGVRTLFLLTILAAAGRLPAMGRPYRAALGGYVYHALNRANGRVPIFQKQED